MSYKLRFNLARVIVPVAFLCFIFSLISFSTVNKNQRMTMKMSGEDIFKGLYFDYGNAAQLIPCINKKTVLNASVLTQEEKKESLQVMEDIISNIKQLNPDFFSRVENEIKSDDYHRISEILNESSDMLLQAALYSKKYGAAFKAATRIVSEINVAEFNLNSEKGRADFRNYISKKQKESHIDDVDQINGSCIIVLVVAVETLAFINSVAVSTVALVSMVYAYAVAVQRTVTKTRFTDDQIGFNKDELVIELAQNF